MKRPRNLFLLILLAVCLIWFFVTLSQHAPVVASNPQGNAGATEPAGPVISPAAQARERAAYDQQTRVWVAKIEQLETKKQIRARAEAKTEQARRWLQRDRRDAWTDLLATNRDTFLTLRAQARHSTNGEVTCTICDGRGRLPFCILCVHNDGKCVNCGGTGRIAGDELCPTCLGSGKCYLCNGSGLMICPFCNDGLIRPNGPQPPQAMPLR